MSAQRLYQPRKAQASPLYRILQDWAEAFLARNSDPGEESAGGRIAPFVERSLRAFLECGVPRFGVVRFRCKSCGRSLFVPFSCKKRHACPNCDAKRSLLTTAHAVEDLLPQVPYRQWVLTLPKRLRFFVHRDPRLVGQISKILTAVLTSFYREQAGSSPDAAPALLTFVQRFGSSINLHIHWHLVLSDGTFALENGRLSFQQASPPSQEQVARLTQRLREGILSRLLKTRAIPEETARELSQRERSGFSLDASVFVDADDRAALGRLLSYCTRPAIAVNRLQYLPDLERVRYRPIKGRDEILDWTPLEFLSRLTPIIPPPYLNLTRYAGALGPRSRLRPAVCAATQAGASTAELLGGWRPPLLPPGVKALGRRLASASRRAWALCLARVFEVYPLLCSACGIEMRPVAAITLDSEITRLLVHLDISPDFPINKPARSPPLPMVMEGSQIDPGVDRWDGIDSPGVGGWTSS